MPKRTLNQDVCSESRNHVPAMFRTGRASVAIADVNQELADAATLEKDPGIVNDHYDKVTSQL